MPSPHLGAKDQGKRPLSPFWLSVLEVKTLTGTGKLGPISSICVKLCVHVLFLFKGVM